MISTLLIATTNPGKLREIQDAFKNTRVSIETLQAFPDIPIAREDENTFLENALSKALHYAQLTNLPTLADDSGLEVDALDGRPGVHSARFAGPLQDDQANNHKLIRLLDGIPMDQRAARFRCAMAVCRPDNRSLTAEGCVEGTIGETPRGHNGFGYDPYFIVNELGKTAAELAPQHKNRISHRGQALREICSRLMEAGWL